MARERHLVVDQNYYRRPELADLVASDPACGFIIPDVALLEMCKSAAWESTLRGSLAILARAPGRARVCITVHEAMQWELRERRSVAGRLVAREFTPNLKAMLRAIGAGVPATELRTLSNTIESIQADAAKDEFNHAANKERLAGLVEITRDELLSAQDVKRLRNGTMDRTERLTRIRDVAPSLMTHYFRDAGFPAHIVPRLLRRKPLTLRCCYLDVWTCFDWIARGGFDGVAQEKVTNQLVDQDYVVLATFFDGVLSIDRQVNEAYADLTWILGAA